MLRATTRPLLAPEFASKAHTGQRWPTSHYGWTYLFNGRKRRFWTRSVNMATTDASRLVNFRHRYGDVIDEVDAEETSKLDANFDINDLRIDDHRRTKFNCGTCGETYERTMKGRIHYQKGCKRGCDKGFNNPSLFGTSTVKNLAQVENGKVLERLQLVNADKGSKERLGKMPAWSHSNFETKCIDCDNVFTACVRSLTGEKLPGSVDFSDMVDLQKRCPSCKHKFVTKGCRDALSAASAASSSSKKSQQQQHQQGYYGGLVF